ncbi:MAG: hypothetical protein J3K34DRAFT_475859, partial [Monoraphidium minutum]
MFLERISSNGVARDVDAGAGALLFSDLARAGKLRAALQLLEAALSAGRADLRAILRFLQLLPPALADARTYNHALTAAARSGDIETATSVVSIMSLRGEELDATHRTTLISAAAAP